MSDAEIAKIDRLALALAREGKEKSRALDAYKYGDPAKHCEFPAESARKEARRVLKAKQGDRK